MSKVLTPKSPDYQVKIRMDANGSCVVAALCDDLDTATAVALQFHQISNSRHYIMVVCDSIELVRLVRTEYTAFKRAEK